jgi:hypothetical protein
VSAQDVVISTERYLQCSKDSTGALRRQLAAAIVKLISSNGLQISDPHILPNVPGGYFEPKGVVGYCNAYKGIRVELSIAVYLHYLFFRKAPSAESVAQRIFWKHCHSWRPSSSFWCGFTL